MHDDVRTDPIKQEELLRSLEEAREDLRLNGPVPVDEVRAALAATRMEDEREGEHRERQRPRS